MVNNFSLSKGEVGTQNERLLEQFIFSLCGQVIEALLANIRLPQNLMVNYVYTGYFFRTVGSVGKKIVLEV